MDPMIGYQYRTIGEIKRANKSHGYHYFEPDTMRFFASQVERQVYGRGFFITSEQFISPRDPSQDGPRKWSVRLCGYHGDIDTVGKNMAFDSLQDAEEGVKEILALDLKYLVTPASPGYGARIFLSETAPEVVKTTMDKFGVTGGRNLTLKMMLSGCEVYMWEFNADKFEKALSYLSDFGFTKSDGIGVELTSG